MLPGKKRTSKLSLRKQHQRPSSSVFQQPRSPLPPRLPLSPQSQGLRHLFHCITDLKKDNGPGTEEIEIDNALMLLE